MNKKLLQNKIAEYLLQSKAIKLNIANPFTWSSGWKSPIYCDNRKTLSFTEIRTEIKEAFIIFIREYFPTVEVIAAVATGGIPQGAMIADAMNLPLVYVRSSPKSHGLERLIEGDIASGSKVVVIEDLVSTGKSSLKALEALRSEQCEVLGMGAVFTYGFKQADDSFAQAQCPLFTLTDYNTLINVALKQKYISAGDVDILKQWRLDPEHWRNM